MSLRLDDDQLQLLDALEKFGNNRYVTRSTYIIGNELMALDKLVWTIRHYTRSFNLEVDGVDKSESYLKDFLPPNPANAPTTTQLSGGALEKILSRDNADCLRQELVLCNRYYGEPENATQVPSIVHSSTTPFYERDWFTKTKIEYSKTISEAVQDFVKFP